MDTVAYANGHVTHHPARVKKDGAVLEQLREGIKFRRPKPFCGHTVHRETAFLHPPGESPKKYRFGGEVWVSKVIPEAVLPTLMPLFAMSAELVGPNATEHPNVVLVQLYTGRDGAISWHADDEKSMARDPDSGEVLAIVSVSLGTDAKFRLRPIATPPEGKRRKSEQVLLKGGDVIVMHRGTQERYHHSIPKGGIGSTKRKREGNPTIARVSLTFRRQL